MALMFADRELLLAIPIALALFALLAWRRGWLAGPDRARRRELIGLRWAIVTLVLVALAQPQWGDTRRNTGQRQIWLVDQSASLGLSGQQRLASLAGQAAGLEPNGNETGALIDPGQPMGRPAIVSFAGQPRWGSATPASLNPQASDLGAALDEGRRLLGPAGGRLVVLSDGQDTGGQVAEATRQLILAGVAVDVYPVDSATPPDVRLDRVVAPSTVRDGEAYDVEVRLSSTAATTATIRLSQDRTVAVEQTVSLPAGTKVLSFPTRAEGTGPVRWQAEVSSPDDQQPENNQVAALTIVYPRPRVLLVADPGRDTAALRQALDEAGITTELGTPQTVFTRLSDLARWDAMVVVDLPASSFTLDQMLAMQEFVRTLGHGLVMTGGNHSFSLGGYKDTPLETVLPVRMDPPERGRRPPVALLVVLDRSASMGSSQDGISKMALAQEAAIRATEILKPEDQIGILTFNTEQEWPVPFQKIGVGLSLQDIQDRISAIQPDGGTSILPAVTLGLNELLHQPALVKHVVLLTDGRSLTTETPDEYKALLDSIKSENSATTLTLSAIGIGFDADQELLQAVAELGGGRYHFAQRPEDIPNLLIQETAIARSEALQQGDFHALLGMPHPALNGLAPADLPLLTGYVGVKLKPQAELALRSATQDPLLASWQYGLGRAVAWLSDTGENWASAWQNWADYGQFWGQVIRYTVRDPAAGPLTAHTRVQGNQATVTVEALDDTGRPVDLADTVATITTPDGTSQELPLPEVEPGRYQQTLDLSGQSPQAYVVHVRQQKGGLNQQIDTGFVVPYPAEYGPAVDGRALLTKLASDTGGRVLTDLSQAQTSDQPADHPATIPLWPYLLAAAAILWPVEIGLRRRQGLW